MDDSKKDDSRNEKSSEESEEDVDSTNAKSSEESEVDSEEFMNRMQKFILDDNETDSEEVEQIHH